MKNMKTLLLPIFATSTILVASCIGSNKLEKTIIIEKYKFIDSSEVAIPNTESGRVAGYIENGIYIYKGKQYAKPERFMPPTKVDKREGIHSSRRDGAT